MDINKFKDIFNKVGKVIGITIAAILLILLAIRIFVKDPQYYKDAKQTRKEYKATTDSIYSKINLFNSRIDNMELGQKMFYDIISQSNQNQLKIQQDIKNLRKYFNEKINRVDRYNISDLDSFFKSRYKQYYPQ